MGNMIIFIDDGTVDLEELEKEGGDGDEGERV